MEMQEGMKQKNKMQDGIGQKNERAETGKSKTNRNSPGLAQEKNNGNASGPKPTQTMDPGQEQRMMKGIEQGKGQSHESKPQEIQNSGPGQEQGKPQGIEPVGVKPQSQKIKFDDFAKLDIRIGKIVVAEKVPNSDKLLRLEFDFGNEKRQILAGIAQNYAPESLVGKQMPVIVNLEPKKMRGLESNGMIVAAEGENGPVLVIPEKDIPAGAKII